MQFVCIFISASLAIMVASVDCDTTTRRTPDKSYTECYPDGSCSEVSEWDYSYSYDNPSSDDGTDIDASDSNNSYYNSNTNINANTETNTDIDTYNYNYYYRDNGDSKDESSVSNSHVITPDCVGNSDSSNKGHSKNHGGSYDSNDRYETDGGFSEGVSGGLHGSIRGGLGLSSHSHGHGHGDLISDLIRLPEHVARDAVNLSPLGGLLGGGGHGSVSNRGGLSASYG